MEGFQFSMSTQVYLDKMAKIVANPEQYENLNVGITRKQ